MCEGTSAVYVLEGVNLFMAVSQLSVCLRVCDKGVQGSPSQWQPHTYVRRSGVLGVDL
jgi:hypothetical protein